MTLKEAFDLYNSLGLKTLPTKKEKSPFNLVTWKGGVSDWLKYDGCYGIGILCGSISGGLECLDFDNHHDDAQQTLTAFLNNSISELYEKYKFPIESTMNGGFHLIYKCSKITSSQKLAIKGNLIDGKIKPDVIIETRGEDAYFVSAPTNNYKWIRNDITKIPVITPEEREVILQCARSYTTYVEPKTNEYEDNNKPGDVYNNSMDCSRDIVNLLTSNGWSEVRNGQWRRPGKKEGISATLGKVAPNIFYVFSSNAQPFELNKGYTAFQILALLKYNGDFKTCAKELAEKYDLKRPEKKKQGDPVKKELDVNKLESILNESYIDLTIPVVRPPIIMKIRDFEGGTLIDRRLFTLGNFSAITGKSKSKKSFLAAMFLASAVKGGIIYNKITGSLPLNKSGVLLFDTEQSYYDAYRYAKNVVQIVDENAKTFDNFIAFNLREYSPVERCEIIDHALTKYKDGVGYVVIDGIADLVNAINDETEATRVITLLMKWTKQFNCHITVNIHQNKNDNFATGWIGSYILKKAECIIAVSKIEGEPMKSKAECQDIRGTSEFKDFDIEIQENGIPIIKDNLNIASHYEAKDVPF